MADRTARRWLVEGLELRLGLGCRLSLRRRSCLLLGLGLLRIRVRFPLQFTLHRVGIVVCSFLFVLS